jgi:hypothetical protein
MLSAVAVVAVLHVGLQLEVQPLKSSVCVGDAVFVRVLVRNPPNAPDTWFLQRRFWLVPHSYPMEGDLGLQIDVDGPDGARLTPHPSTIIVVRMKTHPSSFASLPPGALFGEDLDLTSGSLGFELKRKGVYRVYATLSSAARSWFDKWRRLEGRGEPDYFAAEQLFVGPISSKPAEVVVQDE